MRNLVLSEIWIYPIKSLGGIRLKSSPVLLKGLQFDRCYMLVDETNVFMTQRKTNEMALFKMELADDGFLVRFKNDAIRIPFIPPRGDKSVSATIWQDNVEVFEMPTPYNLWFSERLGKKCKLVFFPEENTRPVDLTYAVRDEHVGLADAFPLLVIGQSSLDDLNSRLKDPVPMNRFRPNIVFTGGKPYEEDTWRNFSVGKNRFVGVKLCARCVLTTVNQDTAQSGLEPLQTLSTYRRGERGVMFGKNLVAVDHHIIQEGDLIVVESFEEVSIAV